MSIGEVLRKTFVPVIDRTAPLQGPLAKAGGVMPLPSFPRAGVDYYLGKLGSARRLRFSRDEIRDVLKRLEYTDLPQILAGYLGPMWSADYGAIWRSPPQSTSGTWHHDNVGHRVKVFVILANESPQNGTEFMPFTHGHRWTSFAGRLAAPEATPLFLRQQAGDVLLFDTNMMHRGMYTPKERIILQVEFTNLLKSFLVPGQVGRYLRSRFETDKYTAQ
jgi:hypothetical protein